MDTATKPDVAVELASPPKLEALVEPKVDTALTPLPKPPVIIVPPKPEGADEPNPDVAMLGADKAEPNPEKVEAVPPEVVAGAKEKEEADPVPALLNPNEGLLLIAGALGKPGLAPASGGAVWESSLKLKEAAEMVLSVDVLEVPKPACCGPPNDPACCGPPNDDVVAVGGLVS